VRAGNLDRRITIQRFTVIGDDGFGNEIRDWADLATVWAQVTQASGREFFAQAAIQADTKVVFKIRYLPGLTVTDRILYNGVLHDLHEVKELGRREGQEIQSTTASA
jgi:SPP1 family predicted phage head-tail adaptor